MQQCCCRSDNDIDNDDDRSIRFVDAKGKVIDVLGAAGGSVHAVPHSVRDLDGVGDGNDPRTPDKLFHNCYNYISQNHTLTQTHQQSGAECVGWLAPLSRCMTSEERNRCADRLRQQANNTNSKYMNMEDTAAETSFKFPLDNTVFVCFDYPVAISAIIINNYSKTPSRGVK